jgi:ABC-2 type transport system permease protein
VTAATAPRSGDHAGTGVLVKLWLRRDRIMIPLWAYALAAYLAATAKGFKDLYGTPAALHGFVTGINGNAATRALYGVVHNTHSVAGVVGWRTVITGSAMASIMNVLLVVRHTRAEEETGRLELVGAGVVGRRALLTSGLLVALLADIVLTVVAVAALTASGMPAAGSLALALAWAATGLAFAGVAAVSAQLTETARSANGIALAVLAASYLIRATGDAAKAPALAWAVPQGWAGEVRPYAGERWAVLLLPAALALILTGAAYRIGAGRDLGDGVLPSRPGPAHAPASLRTGLALAWRLQRGGLLGWGTGLAIYGLVIGSIADGIGDLVKGSSGTRRYLADLGGRQSLVEEFLATAMGMLAMFAAGYVIQAVLRLRSEETAGRHEVLLAAPLTRLRWTLGHLSIAAAGGAALAAVAGLTTGTAHAVRTGDAGQIPRLLGAAAGQVPAIWVMTALTLAVVGLAPRASAASWGLFAAFVFIAEIGPAMRLPHWLLNVAPFTHSPRLPGGPVGWDPIWLTLAALAPAAVGLAAIRHRDLGQH